jgi:hypothetical protein
VLPEQQERQLQQPADPAQEPEQLAVRNHQATLQAAELPEQLQYQPYRTTSR